MTFKKQSSIIIFSNKKEVILMAKKDVNMLEGSVTRGLISFAIPVMLSGFLQMLFQAADLVVLGRFCGSASVGAAGSTVTITNLLINFFMGCALGAGVTTAHAVGERDTKALHRVVHTAIPTALAIGVFLTVIGVIFAEDLLVLIGTPKELLKLATIYMEIIFYGITFGVVQNFGAAILRALGDTRSPLVFLSFAGVLNVILNVIFVTVLHMDVAGVALATITSQLVSALLIVITLMHRTDAARFYLKKMRFHKDVLIKIIKIGIPSGIQSSMFSISNVIIQTSINSFGAAVVSGNSAASNIEGFVYIIMNSFYQATLNFTGQNFGNKNFKRIKEVFARGLILVAFVGIISSAIVMLLSNQLLSLYITDNPAAIEAGIERLLFVCLPYFICGMMEVTTGTIRGMGVSLPPMIISVIGVCIFRMVWIATIFSTFKTQASLFSCYPVTWGITVIAQAIAFNIIFKRKKSANELNKTS